MSEKKESYSYSRVLSGSRTHIGKIYRSSELGDSAVAYILTLSVLYKGNYRFEYLVAVQYRLLAISNVAGGYTS